MPDFEPHFADAELSDDVRDARQTARRFFKRRRRDLKPAVKGRLRAYRKLLDDLGDLLRLPLDVSNVDFTADTRWTAIWQVSARTLSLSNALLAQLEAGLGPETFPTARAIHEANRLLEVFVDDDETALVRQWLAGQTPKPSTVRKALRRSDRRYEAHLREQGQDPPPRRDELLDLLYSGLSDGSHLNRSSTELAVSKTRRTLVIGADPDWEIRAYYASWAGAVIYEVIHVVLDGQMAAGGTDLYEPIKRDMLARLDKIDERYPISDDYDRASAAEF